MADLPRLDLVEARFVLFGFGVPAEMRKRRRALRDAISLLEKVTAQPGYPPDRLDEIRLRMKEAGELFADLTELVEHVEATQRLPRTAGGDGTERLASC